MIKTPYRSNRDKALLILKDIAYISVSFMLLVATLDLLDHLLELVST